jgi:serine/threonine-protein phosphatase 4 regulatory subunit 4
LIQPLLSCEQVASKFHQWRLLEQLITNFQCLVACMTSDQLYTKFVPIIFKYITGSVSDHLQGLIQDY